MATQPPLACIATVIAGLLCACGDEQPARDLSPFVQLAQQANCSDLRNRVFEIANPMTMTDSVVLLDHLGNCADANFRQTLYGETVNDLLCDRHQSIAGPQQQCPGPAWQQLFETVVSHLDDEKLGLGAGFVVREVPVP